MRRALLAAICAAALGVTAAPAHAAFDDPLFFFTPQPADSIPVPPFGYLDGPCGLAVNSERLLYVSDYYHRSVDAFAFRPNISYERQSLTAFTGAANPHTGPVDDPCGLALDSSGNLYLNDYHREVVRFPVPTSLATAEVIDTGDPSDSHAKPTGVAVDPTTQHVFVDDRTYVAEYNPSGTLVQKIGDGAIGDGNGMAVSGYTGTVGYLYVPNAKSDTVEVFDPSVSTTAPKTTISGPPGGFGSLQDSAVAVDNASGAVYVVDTLGPQLTEEPEAVVYVFASDGSYEGRLKHTIVDAAPAGLAVDNSGTSAQGRVYVTSGIAEDAGIYGYPPGAATSASAPPLRFEPASAGASLASSAVGADEASASSAPSPARAAASSVAQKGNLRVGLDGKLSPERLPRTRTAPISVSVGGKISTTDGSLPPLLKRMRIELNRHGFLDLTGLPTCPYDRIQPGSSSHALATCRSALVGRGSFSVDITLSGQEPYPTAGKLLVFNGVRHGKSVLFGHIYSPRPFATSFVIVFAIGKSSHGVYGTSLNASLPEGMKAWGRLTGLEMTLSRRYSYRGKRHSVLSSGCAAPKGFGHAVFPLARASFAFAGGKSVSSVLSGTCRVRG